MAIALQYYCNVSIINYIVHVTLTLIAHPIKHCICSFFYVHAHVCARVYMCGVC